MGGPEPNGWHGDECVLTWLESPWARQLEMNLDGVSWQRLYDGSGAPSANVSVSEPKKTGSSLCTIGQFLKQEQKDATTLPPQPRGQ